MAEVATQSAITQAPTAQKASTGFWVGLLVVLGATGYIVTSSMANTVHYYDVHEAKAEPALVGQTIRLRGIVVDGSHQIRQGTLDEHIFILTAEQETITVLFKGALPDQFEDGASVIATGVLRDVDTFDAEALTAQCPSRYEADAPTAASNDDADQPANRRAVNPTDNNGLDRRAYPADSPQ